MTDNHLDVINALDEISKSDDETFLFLSSSPEDDDDFFNINGGSEKIIDLLISLAETNDNFETIMLNSTLNILLESDLNKVNAFQKELLKVSAIRLKEAEKIIGDDGV